MDNPDTFDWLERLDHLRMDSVRVAISQAQQNSGNAVSDTRERVIVNQIKIAISAWSPVCDGLDGVKKLLVGSDHFNSTAPIPTSEDVRCPKDPLDEADFKLFWQQFLPVMSGFKKNSQVALTGLLPPDAIEAAQKSLLRRIAEEEQGNGYVVADSRTKTNPNGEDVLVVGVVGKETVSPVSPANLTVCRSDAGSRPFIPCPPGITKGSGQVKVFDPVRAVIATVRAAAFQHPSAFSRVVVLAQIPAPEAQELAARIRVQLDALRKLNAASAMLPSIDLIISEAQTEHQSAALSMVYQPVSTTPVLSPVPPQFTNSEGRLSGTVSGVALSTGATAGEVSLRNEVSWSAPAVGDTVSTTVELLQPELPERVKEYLPCSISVPCSFMTVLAVLESLQRQHSDADVVLLERRDLYLGPIPKEFADYSAYCATLNSSLLKECRLQVALDRVLWKGDYVSRLAVKGSDLKKVLDISQSQTEAGQSLLSSDVTQQWMVTFGVSQPPISNLTQLERGEEPLWIPPDRECRNNQDQAKGGTYCVNGKPLIDDQYYWVATSDQLAMDKTVYAPFGAVDDANRAKESETFLSEEIRNGLSAMQGPRDCITLSPVPPNCNSKDIQTVLASAGAQFQQQRLYELDYSKLILSFSSLHALGPTDSVPASFQGVADPRAAVPHNQDFDAESALRLTSDHAFFKPISIGTLTSFQYQRSVKGNLSGSPESVSYAQNTATFGGFLQWTIGSPAGVRSRAVPRSLIVLTPHQYQTQVNNSRVFIGYTATGATGQLAVAVPLVTSFSDRLGYRREWGARTNKWNLDSSSYAEGGMEFSIQNNILKSITLANGSTTYTCTISAGVDIAGCFKKAKSAFPIDGNTQVVGSPGSATLHTPGAYWDLHLQRTIEKFKIKSSPILITESQGEVFFGRGSEAVLPTQTNYAITWNTSVSFPLWGNLAFAPTYNFFFLPTPIEQRKRTGQIGVGIVTLVFCQG